MSIFNWFKKKTTIIELIAVYVVQDKEAVKVIKKDIKKKLKDYEYKTGTLGLEAEKPELDDIEVPTKEDRGIIQLRLDDIIFVSEHDNPAYSLVVCDNGIEVICDYPTTKFKAYLRTKGFVVDELKG